jgi:hypothetical protein
LFLSYLYCDLDGLALVYRMPQRILFSALRSDVLKILTSYLRDLLMMGAWAIALQSFKGDPLPVCTLKAYLFTDELTLSPSSPTTLLVTIVYTKTLSTE